MKKKYSKPEACLIGHENGIRISTSERFAQRAAQIIDLMEKEDVSKEGLTNAGKISGKS